MASPTWNLYKTNYAQRTLLRLAGTHRDGRQERKRQSIYDTQEMIVWEIYNE